jgi:2-hydroxychromene-2-carboxylate isomerase
VSPAREPAQQGQKVLNFFFDFVSPYGYFAVQQIEALASRHGRTLRWHPFHMRAVMKDMLGVTQAMADVPLKGNYVRNDVQRLARQLGLPYNPAPAAGFSSVAASRTFYLLQEHDLDVAVGYARAVFHSQHALACSPNSWAQCTVLAIQAGADPAWLDETQQGGHARALFNQATQAAVAQGVWGTPSFIADGEMFWGCDRLAQLDDWLRLGGW